MSVYLRMLGELDGKSFSFSFSEMGEQSFLNSQKAGRYSQRGIGKGTLVSIARVGLCAYTTGESVDSGVQNCLWNICIWKCSTCSGISPICLWMKKRERESGRSVSGWNCRKK